MSKKKNSASITAEKPIPREKERGKSGGKTEEKILRKHELISSGNASPIATLRYIIDKLNHALAVIPKQHTGKSAHYHRLYANITPVTLFTENKNASSYDSRVNEWVPENAYQIEFLENHNQLKLVFEMEIGVDDKHIRSAAELLEKINKRHPLVPIVSPSHPAPLPAPIGYLVATVFPSCIGRIRLRKSERVFPMALVPVFERYNDTEEPEWKWGLMTVQCQNRYFSERFWVPSDKVGISIEQLLTEFILWNKFHRLVASSDKEQKEVELTVNNVMENISVSPLVPIGSISNIVVNLYNNLEDDEKLPKGFATTTAEIPESRVLFKINNRKE